MEEAVQIVDSSTINISTHMELASLLKTPLKLSSFDLLMGIYPPMRRVLFYDTDESRSSFASHLRALKRSFSKALLRFPTLAGKVVHSPESDEWEIDCSDHPSVTFLEAESSSTALDYRRLVRDEEYDDAALEVLSPSLNPSVTPVPVTSVQVTRFAGGGMAVGIVVHHAAVDGRALWSFINCWAEICRRLGDEDEDVLLDAPVFSFDRYSIFKGLHENVILSSGAHQDLLKELKVSSSTWVARTNYSDPPIHRTFVLSSSAIQSLKRRANYNVHARVSAFVALGAHVWICSTKARHLQESSSTADININEDTCFFYPMDCRPLLNVDVDHYFGNCIKPCRVLAKAHQLISEEDGFSFAIKAIQEGIRHSMEVGVKDCHEWPLVVRYPPPASLYVSGSPRFRVYETDFGWGTPRKVELAGMRQEGLMTLAAARGDEGGVQLTILLPPSCMDDFASLLLDGLKDEKDEEKIRSSSDN